MVTYFIDSLHTTVVCSSILLVYVPSLLTHSGEILQTTMLTIQEFSSLFCVTALLVILYFLTKMNRADLEREPVERVPVRRPELTRNEDRREGRENTVENQNHSCVSLNRKYPTEHDERLG